MPGSVDVVIPTYNARDVVLECLDHLDGPVVARRIVVDDGSEDDTVDAVRARGDADVIGLTEHRGLAYAFNEGARAGDAPFVLFLNNDIYAEPGSVSGLVEALAGDPDAVSAGGRLVEPDSLRTQASYQPRDLPGPAGLLVRLVGLERVWPRNPWTGGHLRDPLDEARTVRTQRQPAGACLLVRRTALDAIGGWDERYWFWYEDVDISRRLARLGPALYVPSAVFRHVGRHSTRAWDKPEQHRRLYHGTLCYAQDHAGPVGRRVVALAMAAGCVARIARLRRDPPAARAYRQILRESTEVLRGRRLERPADAGVRRLRPTPSRERSPR